VTNLFCCLDLSHYKLTKRIFMALWAVRRSYLFLSFAQGLPGIKLMMFSFTLQ